MSHDSTIDEPHCDNSGRRILPSRIHEANITGRVNLEGRFEPIALSADDRLSPADHAALRDSLVEALRDLVRVE